MTTNQNAANPSTTTSTHIDLPVWKTIKLGTFSNTEALIQALRVRHMISQQYRDEYESYLSRISLSPTETEVDLVRLTKLTLGLKGSFRPREIWDRAISHGLLLCPQEAAPQLVLQWEWEQTIDHSLAMEEFVIQKHYCVAAVSPNRLEVARVLGVFDDSAPDMLGEWIWVFVKPRPDARISEERQRVQELACDLILDAYDEEQRQEARKQERQ